MIQRATSPDSSPDHLMTEGMPESTIIVDAPSYPAEIGNEAYRIEQQAEGGAAELDQYGSAHASGAVPLQASVSQHVVRYVFSPANVCQWQHLCVWLTGH